MELESLSPQQLSIVKEQVEEEIEGLTNSFSNLRHAVTKYKASRSALENIDAREILVPLTSSLYVPGRIVNSDLFMVEVGTGYYVEKNKQQSIEFCERKMKMLIENIDKISKFINHKRRYLENVIEIFAKKTQDSRIQN
jgi:prefoldin alpha subunit